MSAVAKTIVHRESTRESILRVASEMFANRGYEATTLQQIANRVGICKQSIFHYYRDKKTLMLAVLRQFVAYCEVSFIKPLHELDFAHSIVIERFIAFLKNDKRSFLPVSLTLVRDCSQEVRSICRAYLEAWCDALCVSLNVSRGRKKLALQLVSELYGAIIAYRTTDDASHIDLFFEHINPLLNKYEV